MPNRSLNLFVLKWPKKNEVILSFSNWAKAILKTREDVVKIGYFGSYARGNWGVGSDLDVIIILKNCELPFELRGKDFDTRPIPVPVDLFIYTDEEFKRMLETNGFLKSIEKDIVWIET